MVLLRSVSDCRELVTRLLARDGRGRTDAFSFIYFLYYSVFILYSLFFPFSFVSGRKIGRLFRDCASSDRGLVRLIWSVSVSGVRPETEGVFPFAWMFGGGEDVFPPTVGGQKRQ